MKKMRWGIFLLVLNASFAQAETMDAGELLKRVRCSITVGLDDSRDQAPGGGFVPMKSGKNHAGPQLANVPLEAYKPGRKCHASQAGLCVDMASGPISAKIDSDGQNGAEVPFLNVMFGVDTGKGPVFFYQEVTLDPKKAAAKKAYFGWDFDMNQSNLSDELGAIYGDKLAPGEDPEDVNSIATLAHLECHDKDAKSDVE